MKLLKRRRDASRLQIPIVIRDAKASDFSSIIKCYWPDPEVPWDPYLHMDILRKHVGANGFLVAEVRGRVIGFLHYRIFRKHPWFDPKVDHYGQILELHILPRFQSQGIGRRLLSEALRRLEESGCEAIYTETDETNRTALKLYRMFGPRPFLKRFLLRRKVKMGDNRLDNLRHVL